MTHYQTLQVLEDASVEVIRAAYKILIQRFHPDKHPNAPQVADQAKSITAAYEVLSNSHRRAEYDGFLRQSRADSSDRNQTSSTLDLNALKTTQKIEKIELLVANWLGRNWVLSLLVLLIVLVTVIYLWPIITNRIDEDYAEKVAAAEQKIRVDQLRANADEQESRIISPFRRKIVLSLRTKDVGNNGTVVIFPEISIVLSKVNVEDSKVYFKNNSEAIARKLEVDLSNLPPQVFSEPAKLDLFLEAAFFKSIYQNHPEPIHNLCPPESLSSPRDCVGMRRIFFPQKYWVTVDKK